MTKSISYSEIDTTCKFNAKCNLCLMITAQFVW